MQYNRILTSALFAGAITGLVAAVLQLIFVQPILLHAELYESGQLVHFGAQAVSANPQLPAFDFMRNGMSVLFTVLVYSGYAMILVALMAIAEMRGRPVSARDGMLWGVAGFLACHFAPGLSLPPEVPGVAAAAVELRQAWWFATVLATGVGLWLIAFASHKASYIVAGALLLTPHLFGAPQPDAFSGPVPPELAALFAARAFGVGMAAWVCLGTLTGHFMRIEGERLGSLTQARSGHAAHN